MNHVCLSQTSSQFLALQLSVLLQAARFEQSFDEARRANGSQAGQSALDIDNVVAPGEEESEDTTERTERTSKLQHQLDQLLNTLPPRDRNIIRMHYGLHHPRGEGMQLRDISRAYGVCHERVRKIEMDAVQRLSRNAAIAGITLPFMPAQ